jgi:hypothetical protein
METVYKFWLWRLILGAVFGAIILIAYPFALGRPAAPPPPICPAEDMVIVMRDYPHPEAGYRCIDIDEVASRESIRTSPKA